MLRWVLYDFKTAKEPWFDEVKALYEKKLKPFCSFEIVHLKTIKQSREAPEQKKKFESQVLLEKLNQDDFIILLDEAGKKLDSIDFAKLIEKINTSGKKRGVFLIGGAYGVSEEIKKKAHSQISLSNLTMNHLVAEAVLLEQFYRAFTILNRIPYHNI